MESKQHLSMSVSKYTTSRWFGGCLFRKCSLWHSLSQMLACKLYLLSRGSF